MSIKLKSKLLQTRLLVVLVSCFFSANLFAQNNANSGSGKTSYEKYGGQDVQTQAESRAEKIVENNIKRTYKVLDEYVEKHGEDIADFGSKQKDKETRFGHEGPERNPLDRLNGRLDPASSWNEYVMDSKIILSERTFPACHEPRLIAEKVNGFEGPAYDPGNAHYAALCRANCIPTIFTPNLNWQVVAYYWPEYQVSVNRAGAQMIDPDIVKENRGSRELYRIPTSQSEASDEVRGKQAQLRMLEQMGIPALDAEKFKDPDYHRPTREFHLRQDGELRYPSAMRPNAFWRAANARKGFFAGYKTNKNCLMNALDPTTDQRKIVANRYDQGIYAILARYPEIRKKTDKERYKYTSPNNIKINEYKIDENANNQFKQNLCASWRMGTNSDVYRDLGKLGFDSKVNKEYLDYCLPGGYDLSGSMVSTELTPSLQADAARVVMAAVWFGSDKGSFSKMNSKGKRTVKYSLYKNRKQSTVPRFVGMEKEPGENKSKIVFVDKIQRIYPTQRIGGDPDGKMGASSKGFRIAAGQRGSECFRPEDIPNWSSEGKTNKSEWPIGLQGSVEDHFGETRWAIWNRRIVCACEDFGIAGGCLNMNGGDNDETVFAGTYVKPKMTPAFEKAIPLIRGYANQTTPPKSPGIAFLGIDLNSVTKDAGRLGSGYAVVAMPPGQEPDFKPSELDRPQDLVICMLAEDRDGKPQDQQQNPNQQQPNNQNPNGGNTGAAPGGAQPGGAPPAGGGKPGMGGGGKPGMGGGGKPGMGGGAPV